MKDFKKFVKNNKLTVITGIICLIFVIFVFTIKIIFFPSESKAIYGDRLEGIEKVKITNKNEDKIVSKLEEKDEVKKASCDIKGRVLNVIITVNDDVSVDTSKGLGNEILTNLEKKQIKYYDIQVFVKKDNDDEKFPIIGYKHQDKDNFSWSKDR